MFTRATFGFDPKPCYSQCFPGLLLQKTLPPQVECRESDLMILGFARTAKPSPEELKKAYKAGDLIATASETNGAMGIPYDAND